MICSHCQAMPAIEPHPLPTRGAVCGECFAEFAEFMPALLAAREIEQDIKVERRARDIDRARDY